MSGKRYIFQVIGSGKFPYSLLSEERCFPSSEYEAEKAFDSVASRRVVCLESVSVPNALAWMKHGWSLRGVCTNIVETEDYNKYHTWPC